MNIREIKQSVNIVDVVGKYVTLRKKGGEYVGLCPFHEDKKASLNVNEKKQVFFCGPCGAKGDVFDFLLTYGRTLKEAADELRGISSAAASGVAEKRTAKVSARVEWKQVRPAPTPGQIIHYKFGRPARAWQYRLADGSLSGYVCRFETREGKQVLPYVYCQDQNGRKEWRWQGFDMPRVLYCLPDILQREKATVLIVEGEKAADAAQTLFPHVVVTCWQGGSNAIDKTDWSVLKGRNVLLWPDNDKGQRYGDTHPKKGQIKPFEDQPGNHAMLRIYDILKADCPVVKWIRNVPELPDKWDIADADWSPDDAQRYARANVCEVAEAGTGWVPEPDVVQVESPAEIPAAASETPRNEVPPPPAEPAKTADEYESYFRFLGYEKDGDGELFVFYVKEARIVHKYRPSALSGLSTLVALAPLDFWQLTFPKKSGDKVDTVACLNWLIRSARQTGVFSARKLRGRGAWIDDGRVVVHAGEKLVVGGVAYPLGRFKTSYIYEAGEDMEIGFAKPMDVARAHHLLEICQLLNWERKISAHLLAGWCVVAPICGALPWRPHIWLTGGAGTGKTWAFQNIVRRMLGRAGVNVQGETSEAGIRQTLGVDALPVVFDEIDGEDRRAADRIQSILGLMRAASAEDGGLIAKGSASGGVKNYRIRSCFAFASIAIALKQQSDRTRVTVLAIVRNHNEKDKNEKWAELQRIHAKTITDEYCEALQARTLSLVPVILNNSKTFAAAAAAVLQDQRAGDQLGPLLAGAFSLTSNNLISYDAALEWVRSRDWVEERALDESRDERRLLAYILDYITRVEANGPVVERTIGELIQIASGNQLDAVIGIDAAQNRLKRLGMKAENGFLYVSNSSNQIAKMLERTPWSVNHNRILERLPGALRTAPERFAGHTATSRSVAIPFNVFTIVNPNPPPPKVETPGKPQPVQNTPQPLPPAQSVLDLPNTKLPDEPPF